jgi:hypothetical protein
MEDFGPGEEVRFKRVISPTGECVLQKREAVLWVMGDD